MSPHKGFETDILPTSAGDVAITFLGHASLLFEFQDRAIYADPYHRVADYTQLPKANLVLITHGHGDHLDPVALEAVRTKATDVVIPSACASQVPDGIVMRNGDTRAVQGIPVEAVPAYNIVYRLKDGTLLHPQGVGNGYVLTFGNVRIYIAGDTEAVPEMKALRDIQVAFLPLGPPAAMTPAMAAEAARAFRPRILYPYHYSGTDPAEVRTLLQDTPEIEVRIRKLA